MSKILINQYYNYIDRALQFGKSNNETAIRNHIWFLQNTDIYKIFFKVISIQYYIFLFFYLVKDRHNTWIILKYLINRINFLNYE